MSIPTITPLPTPPSIADPANFEDRAEDLLVDGLPQFVTEANVMAAAMDDAVIAATEAASGSVLGTSATSVTIGTGSKGPFTTQAGKNWAVGTWLLLASASGPSNWMAGQVTAYSGTSLTVDVTSIGGSGSHNDWVISMTGPSGVIADDSVTFAKMQDIASARLLGRGSGGTGDVEALTLGSGLSIAGGALAITGGAWTEIASSTPTGTGTVMFSSIPATFGDLLVVFEGVSFTSADGIGVEISGNGTDWVHIGVGSTENASDALYGAFSITGYRNNTGVAHGAVESLNADNDGGEIYPVTLYPWRISGGINTIRILSDNYNFDAGTIRLLGR